MRDKDRLNKDKGPKPRKVYRWFILYYTTSYMWIDPTSKAAKLFKKPGWMEWRHMNYNHPLMKRELEKVRKVQEELRKSTEVDWAKMKNTYFTI